ncbi:hypothetical protein Y1Q_0002040 [Alligator mississippiensis]|uniref:Uncharacterized protein n=1 Tax=Alligator mississippiensis TaxID=8496 RepID=A0A151MIT3_ALLMI|nr:hypothetical protein Y1Q_0002040 [Alligator mississippiensis]
MEKVARATTCPCLRGRGPTIEKSKYLSTRSETKEKYPFVSIFPGCGFAPATLPPWHGLLPAPFVFLFSDNQQGQRSVWWEYLFPQNSSEVTQHTSYKPSQPSYYGAYTFSWTFVRLPNIKVNNF